MPAAFVPPTYREDSVVLPVTFPDGSAAELVYPSDLDLASMGVRPYIVGCGRDFNFFYRHDPKGTWYDGDRPLETYTGAEQAKSPCGRAGKAWTSTSASASRTGQSSCMTTRTGCPSDTVRPVPGP